MLTANRKIIILLCAAAMALAAPSVAWSQGDSTDDGPKLLKPESEALRQANSKPILVGVTEAPPFSYKVDGEWQGLSIDLWKNIARDLGIKYTIRDFTIEELISALDTSEVDVGVGALDITAERDENMRFGHTFHHSGYGVATRDDLRPRMSFIDALISKDFLAAIGSLLALLLLVGTVVWMIERRGNPKDFGGNMAEGLGSGLWWSAVTMSTVGYGDKYPRTAPGRLIAIIWIFASIIVISGFTGAIASSLTLGRMVTSVEELDDLRRLKTGAVADSSASVYLRDHGIRPNHFQDITTAIDALEANEIDAVVHDAPILHYILDSNPRRGISTLRVEFGYLNYAYGFPVDSRIARPVGIQLLREIEKSSWPSLVRRYLPERR